MNHRILAGLGAALLLTSSTAFGADAPPLKIGIVYSYTGTSPDNGIVMDSALNAYLLQHNGTIAGRKVQLIRRDDTGVAPDVAKRMSQELIVQENVDFLIGATFTPNGIAMESVSTQAKKPFCIINAAGTNILMKAPYTIRCRLRSRHRWGERVRASVYEQRRQDAGRSSRAGRDDRVQRLRPAREGRETGRGLRVRRRGAVAAGLLQAIP
jgi:hypothetical protein